MIKPKSVYVDFEFNQVTSQYVNLVCATTQTDLGVTVDWWLHNSSQAQSDLATYLNQFDTIIAYNAVAEARSFISLGLNPLNFKWIDLFLEYRCLSNHSDDLNYGYQLVNGVVKEVSKPKPKWERVEGEELEGFKPTHSLAEATFKLLGKSRNTAHKDAMRDLIISDPKTFGVQEKIDIQAYCREDVVSLPELHKVMEEIYFERDETLSPSILNEEMLLRGKYAAHTAIMETVGYPLDLKKTQNFSRQVSNILYDCQSEINDLFPSIKPFVWEKAQNKFRWNQLATRKWIEQNATDLDNWERTDTGALSLSLDAWTKFYNFSHSYPKDNFGAQMVRFLKLKQSLYGFVPSPDKKKRVFWDSVGPDGRVRPYMNIYGSQSSRSQPASTGFMFLKPAWMRALVQPKPRMAMAGIDFGSQEFFISALLSRDPNMIQSYLSGDVYLAFGKLAGLIPENGTKETHEKERNLCKSTVLGISYLMSKYGLANKLTQDSGEVWTEDEAQEMIDAFYESYPNLKEYQDWIVSEYKTNRGLKLPCGWYMWGDNPNERSVTNCPVQGFGASIMRKAVDLAVCEKGLSVVFTLHDAIYIEYEVGNEESIDKLADAMQEAFAYYFDDDIKDLARKIRLDPSAWSPDYKANTKLILPSGREAKATNLYIDKRAIEDWNAFSKYFESPTSDLL